MAAEAKGRLGCPALERHSGAWLLGSTAPDIRIITRWSREQTHFGPLSSDDVCAGVKALFQAHPYLVPLSRHSTPTQAFLLGYLCHLMADQAWVVWVYRPYFGNPDVYDDAVAGNVMDRALQLELDRQATVLVAEARALLDLSEEGVEVGFIDGLTLRAWREWVQWFLGQGFAWGRLHSLARRQDSAGHDAAGQAVETFLASVQEGLESIYSRVPQDTLGRYKEGVFREMRRLVQEQVVCV
jgi:hypothetical protein